MNRLLVLLTASGCLVAGLARADSHQDGYVALSDGAQPLIDDFNRAKGAVRLLFVVDPTCSHCLRGLDDMNKSLLAAIDDPRLQTYVVHVPVIGAKAKDVAQAAKLLHNRHVRHYWNESGVFGRKLSEALDLEHEGKPVYAWDVWMLFGADAECSEGTTPTPRLLMHQLRELDDSKFPRLDSDAFAREVRAQLVAAPAVAAMK